MKNLPDKWQINQSEEQSRKIGTMYPRDKFNQMCVTGDPEVVKKKKKWGDRKKKCFKKQWLKFFRILVELTHKSKSIANS